MTELALQDTYKNCMFPHYDKSEYYVVIFILVGPWGIG